MPEGLSESRISFTKENISNALTLAKEIKPLIGNKSDSSAEQTKVFLNKIYPGTEYTSFDQILNIAAESSNASDEAKIRARNAADMVGAAALIAGGDKILAWAAAGRISENIPEGLSRIDEVISKNLFVRDNNDEVGKFIVDQLKIVEKLNTLARLSPGSQEVDKRKSEVSASLMDKFLTLDEDSEDAIKLGHVYGMISESAENKSVVNLRGNDDQKKDGNLEVEEADDDEDWIEKPHKKYYVQKDTISNEELEKKETIDPKIRAERDRQRKEARLGIGLNYETEKFPDNYEDQKKYIEERLNYIENYKTRSIKGELALGHHYTYPLYGLLAEGKIDERLLSMIETRLTLKEMGDAIGNCSGSMDDRGGLVATISNLYENGYSMTPEVMKCFFKNEMAKDQGFRTVEAWNLMEEVNFNYEKMVCAAAGIEEYSYKNTKGELVRGRVDLSGVYKGSKKIEDMIKKEYGTKKRFCALKALEFAEDTPLEGKFFNYFLESSGDVPRAKIIKEYLIERLIDDCSKKGVKLSDYQARKSFKLTEEMFNATGESFVMDWDFINGDEYAELIHTSYIRKLDGIDGRKGKLTGPEINKLVIKSLTPGWLRFISIDKDTNEIIPPHKMITAQRIAEYALDGQEEKETIIDDETGEEIRLKKEPGLTRKNTYAAHFGSIIQKKVFQAKKLIFSSATPKVEDVKTTQYWQGVLDSFNKVDGQIGTSGQIRTYYAAGVLEMALFNRDTKWNEFDIKRLKDILTKDIIRERGVDGIGKPFLLDFQWQWIVDKVKVNQQIRKRNLDSWIVSLLTGGK